MARRLAPSGGLAITAVVALVIGLAVACGPPVDRPTPAALITGPITGGRLGIPFTSMNPDLAASSGYTEEEYFASGNAIDYAATDAPADGRWTLGSVGSADYKTRLLVRRPSDMSRFSGNVVVEWFNVTGGIDVDADFGFLAPQIVANGDIYVGVSAQHAGVDDPLGIQLGGITVQGLKQWDPSRYGTLEHPGDQYSYDIFSQVGEALKAPNGVDVLHGAHPKRVIAVGESQSAARMFAYVNGVHPLAKVYDGFLIHSRGGSPALAGYDGLLSAPLPSVALVRTDLDVPVLQFETETDLTLLGFLPARQPDTPMLRTWEVAGTAHADKYLLAYQESSVSQSFPGADLAAVLSCPSANDGPQQYVIRRALAALERWAGGGPAPAHGEPLVFDGTTIARDSLGNAVGGIRTPAVDAPIAALSGLPDFSVGGNFICGIFGSTKPFDAATLAKLYPTHDAYVSAVRTAARRSQQQGFLTAADADALIEQARAADIP